MTSMADETPPFYYANVMEANLSAFDFTIDFGYRRPQDRAPTTVCSVAMSLSHAKSMLPIIARLIAQYESQFGQIPAPGYEDQAKE
jgi:Protein of unknown function (DUF3467)